MISDLKLKVDGKGVQGVSHITPSCIAISSKKLRRTYGQRDGNRMKGIGYRVYKIHLQFEKVEGLR